MTSGAATAFLGQSFGKTIAFLDRYLLPANATATAGDQRRARVLAGIALVAMFSVALESMVGLMLNAPPHLLVICGGAFFGYASVLLLLRYQRTAAAGAHVFCAVLLGVGAYACLHRDTLAAVTSPWLFAVPVMANYLLGPRGSAFYGAVVFVEIITVYSLHHFGLVIPTPLMPAHAQALLTFTALTAIPAICFFSILDGAARADAERRLADSVLHLRASEITLERNVEELKLHTSALTAANESLAQEMAGRLRVENELHQAQKLESVGRLAAGVAHEINTPMQFVSDNVHFLREATGDLLGVIDKLQLVEGAALAGARTTEATAISRQAAVDADLPYLRDYMPKALDRCIDGLERVTSIVRSLKEFAHPDAKEMSTVDLNRAIESTLVIARNEYKYVATLHTELSELPPVQCFVGEINQVLLNIVVNAAHAIGDVVKGTEGLGLITVRSWREGQQVVISIGDTGTGIPENLRHRVFDPFFTTKEVGRGTGQGLSIARSVVVDGHHGTLSLESETGKGTTFFIRLPVAGAQEASVAA